MLRGGALKKTTTGEWCHVVCAIAFPEVYFEDIQERDGINIENLNPARRKLVKIGSCLFNYRNKKRQLYFFFSTL